MLNRTASRWGSRWRPVCRRRGYVGSIGEMVSRLKWDGIGGERVELWIAGYEFPDSFEDYDANWVFLEATFRNELGSWSCKSPCLLTWELGWLRRWMHSAVSGNAQDVELTFLEPDLKFHHLGFSRGDHCFAVVAGASLAFSSDCGDALLNIRIPTTLFAQSLATIDEWIEAFPPRGRIGRDSLSRFPGPKTIDNF